MSDVIFHGNTYPNVSNVQYIDRFGVSHSVSKLVENGVEVWSSVPPVMLSTYNVGSTVRINVNGVSTEWIVVQQGSPDDYKYDASCNGTWLLMKDIYTVMPYDSTDNDYANSDAHTYLNTQFINYLDTNVRNIVKTVKIPYTNGAYSTGSIMIGADGLSVQLFLLSGAEVGVSKSYMNVEGMALEYFNDDDISKRYAYYNGILEWWWLRSPYDGNSDRNIGAITDKTEWALLLLSTQNTSGCGIRPAMILPFDTLVSNGFIQGVK
jgi:hypothetical protein